MFGRQEMRYKWVNETLGILNNDTILRNNTLVSINVITGAFDWAYSFGNDSSNRFMEHRPISEKQYVLVFVCSDVTYGRMIAENGTRIENGTEVYQSRELGTIRAIKIINVN
jgi:hypothetical protein